MASIVDIADDNLLAILSYLPAACLVKASVSCKSCWPVSQSDRLWLPLNRQRWRFGSSAATADAMLPGGRDKASASALADAQVAPMRSSKVAFDFFCNRCKEENQVIILALQNHCAYSSSNTSSSSRIHPGVVVNMEGRNDYGVVGSHSSKAEAPVSVFSASTLDEVVVIDASSLTVIAPALKANDAERQILEAGDDAIDALIKMSKVSCDFIAAAGKRLLADAMEVWAIKQWRLLKESKERLDALEEGAFIVAQWGEPAEVNVASVRDDLASLAEAASARASSTASLQERIEAVNHVLFAERGLTGNTQSYYEPQNSYLHKVLSRKMGIPISLSIVWAAVARRLDIPCHLCAKMPNHIIIRVVTGEGSNHDLFVDAFNRKIMDYSALVRFSLELVGDMVSEEWIADGPPSLTYQRLLRNLFGIFQRESAKAQQNGNASQLCASVQQTIGIVSQMASISDESRSQVEYMQTADSMRKVVARLHPLAYEPNLRRH